MVRENRDLYPYGVPRDELGEVLDPLPGRELVSPKAFGTMLFDLIRQWFTSRPLSVFWAALPALIIFVTLSAALLWWTASDNINTLQRYNLALNKAFQDEDWNEANLLIGAILRFEPDDPHYRFKRAMILRAQGQDEEARELFRALAPLDANGHTPARFEITRAAVAERDLQTAILQMQRARLDEPDNDDVTRTLAQLYLRVGEFGKAESLLEVAAKKTPELLATLAAVQEQTGNDLGAKQTWREAAEFYRQRWINLGNEDDLKQAAVAYAARQDFREAEELLVKARAQRETPQVLALLADLYTLWSRDFRDKKDVRNQWRLLAQALKIQPRHLPTLVDVAELSLGENEDAETARSLIQNLLAEGEAPGAIHMLVGAHAAQDGDLEKAEYHLQQAVQHDGRTPAILNNLAWVLALRDDAKLEEAKRMVDEALTLPSSKADRANMLDTRGMILFKMKKYPQALADYEKALNLMPDTEIFLQHLVEAYRALGDDAAEKAVLARMQRLGFEPREPRADGEGAEETNGPHNPPAHSSDLKATEMQAPSGAEES